MSGNSRGATATEDRPRRRGALVRAGKRTEQQILVHGQADEDLAPFRDEDEAAPDPRRRREVRDRRSVQQKDAGGDLRQLRGSYLIGTDGARSAVRKALGIVFEGQTIPEIFLAMSTHRRFDEGIADLAPIAYISDPKEWVVLLRTPSLWRVLLPTDPNETEEEIRAPENFKSVSRRSWRRRRPTTSFTPRPIASTSASQIAM